MTPLSNNLKPGQIPSFKTATSVISPRQQKLSSQNDFLVLPEFINSRLFLLDGITWLRILPPLDGSLISSGIYTFQTYYLGFGAVPEIPVPESLTPKPKARNAISGFLNYLRTYCPGIIYDRSKGIKNDGLYLFPMDRAICWVYPTKTPPDAKYRKPHDAPIYWWFDSAYSGGVNSNRGIFDQILRLMTDEIKSPNSKTKAPLRYGDITHPGTGRLLGVDMYRSLNVVRYEGLTVDESRCHPVSEIQGLMAAHPQWAIYNRPIESIVRPPSEDDLIRNLRQYIDHQISHGFVSESLANKAFSSYFGISDATGLLDSNLIPEKCLAPAKPLSEPTPVVIPEKVSKMELPSKPAADEFIDGFSLIDDVSTPAKPPQTWNDTAPAVTKPTPVTAPKIPATATKEEYLRILQDHISGTAKNPNISAIKERILLLYAAELTEDEFSIVLQI